MNIWTSWPPGIDREGYRRFVLNKPKGPEARLCPCGCGAELKGKQKAASPACRQRLSREARRENEV